MKLTEKMLIVVFLAATFMMVAPFMMAATVYNIYTAPLNANDSAYQFLYRPAEDWFQRYGQTERTVILFNLSKIRGEYSLLEERVEEMEESVKELSFIPTGPEYMELKKTLIIEGVDPDPNNPYITGKTVILDKGARIYYKVPDPNDPNQ
jgi:hypothetical protein